MRTVKRIIGILMAVALLIAGTAALGEGTITVKGFGVVNLDANRVTISLGVRQVAGDAASAQASVNENIGAVIEALRAMGVDADAISTSGLGVYPNYSYDEVETITGYTAYNTISLTLSDVNNSGKYIDAAFAAGANSLDYVEFSVADTSEAADTALTLAVESATDKARTLAQAAGVKLGALLEIDESNDDYFDPSVSIAKNAEATGNGADTEVLASKQRVTASVRMTFAID